MSKNVIKVPIFALEVPMQFRLLDAPFNSHTLSFPFLNKKLFKEVGYVEGACPLPI